MKLELKFTMLVVGKVKEDEEEISTKYMIYDLTTEWNKMKPMVGDICESLVPLKFCIANYLVSQVVIIFT